MITLNRPVFSNIRYGNPIENFSVSNFRSRCPTLDEAFQRCPPCTREEATDQASQLNLYAEGIRRISGFRLTVAALSGSKSNVGLIFEQLNTKYIDYCSATTHVQNLSTQIRGFQPEYQRLMVMKTLEAISSHVLPHCTTDTDTLLEASLDDKSLIFVSRKPLKSNVKISILDIIDRCYRDGHKFSRLLTIPNLYDDDFFKSQLESLIIRKMVDIVRLANEKRTRCEEYTAIDMSVHSLAVWHSYVGLHARWDLGVRHDKKRDARVKRKYCNQEGCGNKVQQGGVCIKHGAKVKRKNCSQEGCGNKVRQGGVCIKHGAIVKRCSQEGCGNKVQQGGVCVQHGARVKRCSQDGCDNQVVQGGVCVQHGARVKISRAIKR
jgi:hypothetical protein